MISRFVSHLLVTGLAGTTKGFLISIEARGVGLFGFLFYAVILPTENQIRSCTYHTVQHFLTIELQATFFFVCEMIRST